MFRLFVASRMHASLSSRLVRLESSFANWPAVRGSNVKGGRRCTQSSLDAEPGKRLYSPYAHCFCCICSWMVQKPHLRPKKVNTRDKKVAERMKRTFLLRLAKARGISVTDETLDDMLQEPNLREPIGLCTYAADLLERLKGRAVGAASLALWRSFAWTPQGSPKKGFVLSADEIMLAQDILAERLAKAEWVVCDKPTEVRVNE